MILDNKKIIELLQLDAPRENVVRQAIEAGALSRVENHFDWLDSLPRIKNWTVAGTENHSLLP